MTFAVRLRRAAHNLWVTLLALALAAACATAAADWLGAPITRQDRITVYCLFPILLIVGATVRLLSNRFWPVVRRLEGVAGPRATIVLGQLTVTSGRLVFGDPGLPPKGLALENVPNGTFNVLGEVLNPQRGAALASFHIVFRPQAQPDSREKVAVTIRSGILAISDPRGGERPTGRDRRRARRLLRQRVREGRDDPSRPFFHTHLDDAGKPWSVTFEAGRGRDEYRLHVKRLGGTVVRVDCTLIAHPNDPEREMKG